MYQCYKETMLTTTQFIKGDPQQNSCILNCINTDNNTSVESFAVLHFVSFLQRKKSGVEIFLARRIG